MHPVRKVNGVEIVDSYEEFAVEYEVGDDGELFVTACDDEEQARRYRAVMGGTLLVRTVHETAWAELESAEVK